MAADDFQNTPPDQGFPAGLDNPSSFSGNRPASGARRATPGEVLSQGFQGAQNAGDFLGLDTEFTASQDPNQGYGGDPSLDLVPPPSTFAPDDSGYAPVPEPAPLPASDPVQDFAQAPSAFEFGEDLGSDESAASAEAEGVPSRKTPMLVASLLVAGLVTAGVFYGPSLYHRFVPGAQVAEHAPGWEEKPTRPKPATPPAPAPEAAPTASATPTAPTPDPEPTVSSSTKEPLGTTNEPSIVSPLAVDPKASLGHEAAGPGNDTLQSALVGPLAPAPAVNPATPRPGFPDLAGAAYEWASEDQLELIWRGSEVPLEAVQAPAKTLMPRVGNVRVFTTSGDVFDGRLYAVGQGLVWLDGGPGRVGLDGSKVERIEVLPPAPQGTKPSAEVVGGRRVRVKVPGGMLYGSVLKSEGEDVTLALESGGRVRVKAADIQDLGTGRAIVVGR